jgi:hypothetical protein
MILKQFAALGCALLLASACSAGPIPNDDPAAAGDALTKVCVQSVLCIQGSHWDPVACQCVPDQCVSGPGGPCGGFTTHPCVCRAGTKCVLNHIPDIPGRCAVCDPIKCGPGTHWDTTSCQCVSGCRTAADCRGLLPQLCKQCADGSFGCAHHACVAGQCEVAYCANGATDR